MGAAVSYDMNASIDNKNYCAMVINEDVIRYQLLKGFQQRKLPKNAGEWPAKSIKTARRSKESARNAIFCLSNKSIKNDMCKVTKSVSAWAEVEEPASKLSFTLVNLKTL